MNSKKAKNLRRVIREIYPKAPETAYKNKKVLNIVGEWEESKTIVLDECRRKLYQSVKRANK